MIQTIVIALTVIVAAAGFAVAAWSIHRTHCLIRARQRQVEQHVTVAIQHGSKLSGQRPPLHTLTDSIKSKEKHVPR
jgi:hypothetical protein